MENKYTFGECNRCGKRGALKNGYCTDCVNKVEPELPQEFKDIFGL